MPAKNTQGRRKRRGYRIATPAEFGQPLKPAWIRADQAPDYFGVSRSTLYVWLDSGRIVTKAVKVKPASQRTIRLINFESLSKFVDELPATEAAAIEPNKAAA